MRTPLLGLSFLVLFAAALFSGTQEEEEHVISRRIWHLGNDDTPEWPEGPIAPDGTGIELTFQGQAFEGDGTLVLTQRHVNDPWHVEINGTRVCTLAVDESLGEHTYHLPAGVIRDGENTFRLIGEQEQDDITVGDFRYYEASFRELFGLERVVVEVRDVGGDPLPARVTVTDAEGELVELFYAEELHAAVRLGVCYTSDGEAVFEVPAGRYAVHAVRGPEWSLDSEELTVAAGGASSRLTLRRELDTTGFVAADTHVHTRTYSGHGDSSVEERMVTLAGEGVELAIATDHNHNTDYRPVQESMGLTSWFTPVVGNEVTTPIGHLNGFPLDPADEVPPFDLQDVGEIVAGMRAKGARAVILNHPRWPSHETGPHGVMELDLLTGDWKGDWSADYDAMELINSQTEEREPMLLFRDWFAMLNRGEAVYGVGSSDSHTVGGVVGQGRTYVLSSTDDPAAIDVEECAENIANGRSSVSMGIFCDLRFADRSILGLTYSPEEPSQGGEARSIPDGITLRVAAPSWVRPRKVTLFANGVVVKSRGLDDMPEMESPGPLDLALPVDPALAWPDHDFWMVALVEGDGVGGAFWPQLNDYTLAATNPVFFDVDGDGRYTSPRRQAEELVEAVGTGEEALQPLLARVDEAVGVQLLRLARRALLEDAEERARALGRGLDRPWLDAWGEESGDR